VLRSARAERPRAFFVACIAMVRCTTQFGARLLLVQSNKVCLQESLWMLEHFDSTSARSKFIRSVE
jgi:hypothetical protein